MNNRMTRRTILTLGASALASFWMPLWPTNSAEAAPLLPSRDPLDDIIKVVARSEGVTVADILGASRSKEITRARHRAMYLAKRITGKSLPDLGRRFGVRDHTTVLHGVRKIEMQCARDPRALAAINLLSVEVLIVILPAIGFPKPGRQWPSRFELREPYALTRML